MRYYIKLLCAIILIVIIVNPTTAQSTTPVYELTFGFSGQGRPITGIRIGQGPRKLMLIGNTHGGPEANTYELVTALAEYFTANPHEIPASLSVYIIPSLNPDGLALNTRFNANMVDLNRNMNTNFDACSENDWRGYVQGSQGIESQTGGRYAESEVESRVLKTIGIDASAIIFYHSDGGDVFPAFCEHEPSIKLAQRYAEATGYRYDRYWTNYMITGGMHDWAGSLGIAAITPELFTGELPDYEENLAGVKMLLANAEELVPLLEDQQINDVQVPAIIWRYWLANGGAERFGLPLRAAETNNGVTRQTFENAEFILRPELTNTAQLIQLASLGQESLAEQPLNQAPVEEETSLYFPETGYSISGAIRTYWEQSDGRALFGPPLSPEHQSSTSNGAINNIQVFERAILINDPEQGVSLEALGTISLIKQQLQAPTHRHTIR